MTRIDIAIPALNEEGFINDCVSSVLNFKIPPEVTIKIYVIDGGSSDKTAEIVDELSVEHPNIFLLNNPKRIQSAAMNKIINEGDGDYIMRLDAHSFYPPNYLESCLETALRTNADNVGGIFITKPGSESYGAKVVQSITSHSFGIGNSSFRINAREGSVDTVPYGFFKRSFLSNIGNYDERLLRGQDYELNSRIIHKGGTIWLNPDIKIFYYNQPSFIAFIKKNFYIEAPYNAYMWYFAPYTFSFRHSITPLFTLGFIGGLVISQLSNFILSIFIGVMVFYFMLSVISATQLAIRYKNPRHLVILPISFFIFHFSHGLGVLSGIFNILFRRVPGIDNLPKYKL